MRVLYVMRHAKSSWAETDLADFDRPLNDRGQRDAPFMGNVMRDNGYVPDIILSSPAVRARETARLVRQGGELNSELASDDRIYEASPQTLRQVVSEINDKCPSAMLVGHNPGIEGFIRYLTGTLEPMPTAALAVIELNAASWSSVAANSGKVIKIIRPKDELKSAQTIG
ncbi:MAG TPA: histidine phosphatase family protein [Pyrinomonadaceae bacterium]|nr:histidine phosphatase family protein [Pyrinomonadaceae bacterium]